MSTPPPPPGSGAYPEDAGARQPQYEDTQHAQYETQPGPGAPQPKKGGSWVWPAIVAVVVLGILAGVIAANDRSSSPTTVVNQQSTSTTNSIGVSVQAPKPAQTTTVTAPTKTVTTPAQTVTAPAPAVTTPPSATTTGPRSTAAP